MSLVGVRLSGADPVGKVHYAAGGYLRIIPQEAEAGVTELFASGFLRELVALGFFPQSDLVSVPVEEAGVQLNVMAVQHEAVLPLLYPDEWSFAMLQAAALRFLDLVEYAYSRGYTLADAHPFNFVFRGSCPVWVDLGSFRKVSDCSRHPWLEEFLVAFVAPLRMWRKCPFIARKIVGNPLPTFTLSEIFNIHFVFGGGVLARKLCRVFAKLSVIDSAESRKPFVRFAKLLFSKNIETRIASLRRTVQSQRGEDLTSWSGYHGEYLVDNRVPATLDPRFERIYDYVSKSNPRSVLDLAGNAGVLSEAISRRLPAVSVTCVDYDSLAIDGLFRRLTSMSVPNLSLGVLNFMCFEWSNVKQSPTERLKSDCVLALAVTHHLLLSQGYCFDDVFSMIKAYAACKVFVEYMPLGLHDGMGAAATPVWYTEENFQRFFAQYFDIDAVEQLDENRILFCGTVR